jgi:hypothetical protein
MGFVVMLIGAWGPQNAGPCCLAAIAWELGQWQKRAAIATESSSRVDRYMP